MGRPSWAEKLLNKQTDAGCQSNLFSKKVFLLIFLSIR
jgi:hypothetical protein